VEVIEMVVLLIGSAITFVVSAWLYASTVSPKVERGLSLLWIVSLSLLATVSTLIALAHI
jgi:hypothetical protein